MPCSKADAQPPEHEHGAMGATLLCIFAVLGVAHAIVPCFSCSSCQPQGLSRMHETHLRAAIYNPVHSL